MTEATLVTSPDALISCNTTASVSKAIVVLHKPRSCFRRVHTARERKMLPAAARKKPAVAAISKMQQAQLRVLRLSSLPSALSSLPSALCLKGFYLILSIFSLAEGLTWYTYSFLSQGKSGHSAQLLYPFSITHKRMGHNPHQENFAPSLIQPSQLISSG